MDVTRNWLDFRIKLLSYVFQSKHMLIYQIYCLFLLQIHFLFERQTERLNMAIETGLARPGLTLITLEYFYEPWEPKGLFQFEIIINVLVGSSCFILIPMLCVYGLKKYFYFSTGTVFIRQNLTSTDVRFWRIKTVPALKKLIPGIWWL